MEKAATRLNQEISNSKYLHMKNERFKELIVKLGVNPEDKITSEALLQRSQVEIHELRHRVKMLVIEHAQSKELAQVEEEKEILAKELIERNNEIVALKQ